MKPIIIFSILLSFVACAEIQKPSDVTSTDCFSDGEELQCADETTSPGMQVRLDKAEILEFTNDGPSSN